MIPRLKTTYQKEIVQKLMNTLSLKNKNEVPKVKKIILNMGLGEDASDNKNSNVPFISSGSNIPLFKQDFLYFVINFLGWLSNIPPGLIEFILMFLPL